MIKLIWEDRGQTICLSVDDSIPTCDLLEVIDLFIKITNRTPTGVLDYTNQEL
tara:strand:+ start:410 stop:568 length:159 start_codon:yes stop_codon:yes gene_type:complete